MCLSVPAKIVHLEGQTAQVEVYSQRRQVFMSIDGASVGDWVLVYGSIALCLLDSETAQETIDLLEGLRPPENL